MKNIFTPGDDISATQVNENFNLVNSFNAVAGENITVTDGVPVPVYIKPSDGKIYRSNASVLTSALFDGFINVSVSSNGPVDVFVFGIMEGFTGLTTGSLYFISDSAGILTNAVASSAYPQMVGRAVSATQIFIDKTSKILSETITIPGGTGYTKVATATKPWKYAIIQVTGYISSGTIQGGQMYLERGVVTSASQWDTGGNNITSTIVGSTISSSPNGNGDGNLYGIAGGTVYFYSN